MFVGIMLAVNIHRTVASWIRGAACKINFQNIYQQLPVIGKNADKIYDNIIDGIIEKHWQQFATSSSIRIIGDDTPTKRYGPKIEGAGHHHNPTPGKTDAKLCFGHSWVVLAIVITHPHFGEIYIPIDVELYLRQKELDKLQSLYPDRTFKTKTTILVAMIQRVVEKLKVFNKRIEVIIDGGYAHHTVLQPLGQMSDIVTITRLRHDAVVFEIPPARKKGQRGRPKLYGERINMKGKVDSSRGWQYIECVQYGETVTKRIKSFLAVSKLTKGVPIRVVIVKEDDGAWVPLISTDANLGVKEILESYGIRFGIEEMFKDLKEVCGWGKQQVRKLESNEAVTALNMLEYHAVILSTWDLKLRDLVDRSLSPWDDQNRRPSFADRRNYLRYEILKNELLQTLKTNNIPSKINSILKKIIQLAS
ncbi:MAG: transposase [Planctomycetaceae bacterium]|nr:transposase [Planctomycetaceae bacterium]